MAEIKTLSNFKDWLLISLLAVISWLAGSTYITVNNLATKDAVREAIQIEKEKRQAKVEADVRDLQQEQKKQADEIGKIQQYLKPREVKSEEIVER